VTLQSLMRECVITVYYATCNLSTVLGQGQDFPTLQYISAEILRQLPAQRGSPDLWWA